jgi:hypothetical protein
MKYKEFIQAVDSLTNEALVANKEAIPWKVDIDDQDVKVVNQKTGQPLLKISKHTYGTMLVYQLTDSTAVSIFEEAVLLNETPLDERDEVVNYNPLHDSINFLKEVSSQLTRGLTQQNWNSNGEEYRTFYFVCFKLWATKEFVTVNGPHLQGSLSLKCKSTDTFEDKIKSLIHMANIFKDALSLREETINSALEVLDDHKDDPSLQFSMGRIIINNKHIIISTDSGAYFMWTNKPTYFGSQKKFHEILDD